MQNEIIRLMTFITLRDIAKNIKDSIFYLIMADEVADCSRKEQFVICFRQVDKDFDTYEDFIGIDSVDNIKTDSLVTVIKDVLIRLNIPLSNARGQCYDGEKNICDIKSGVSNKSLSDYPKAFFTHCFGHTLNLAVGNMVKNVRFLKDIMEQHTKFSILLKDIRKEKDSYRKFKKIYHQNIDD